MKKKGTTESYSAFIGIVIAFLMLMAIGCAVYNMYKPKGLEYFNKLTSHLQKLEESNTNEPEGEMAFYIEKDKFLVGFGKKQEYVGEQGWISLVKSWKCYGIEFGWTVPSIIGPAGNLLHFALGITDSIDRPKDKCPLDKGCLCLCKMSFIDEVKQDACQGMEVKCKVFDSLEFFGGEGCPQGVFIPGTKYTFARGSYPRDMAVLYYSKQDNFVSIDDKKALSKEELEKRIEKDIKNATAEKPVEESSKASVVLSSSCGEENKEVKEGVKTQLRDNWELIPVEVKQKPEEGACLMPEDVAKGVESYKSAEYFLQIETDKTIASENQVVVNSVEGNEWSLKLAEYIANELKADGFDVVEGFTNDPVMKLFIESQKAAVEVKMQKGDPKAIEPIAKAVADKKGLAKKNCAPGAKEPDYSCLDAEGWTWPVEGTPRVTSCFGQRDGTWHAGIDLGAAIPGTAGDPVYAINNGVVRKVVRGCPNTPDIRCGGGYGNYVVVNQDDGYTVIYAHLTNQIPVNEKEKVIKGQRVGRMGNTGHSTAVHLHLGVYDEENMDASSTKGSVNPVCLLDTTSVKSRCTISPGTIKGDVCPVLV